MAAGAGLGLLGSLLGEQARASLVSLAALGLLGIGLWHLYGTRPRMAQRDCETAQEWMDRGPIRWALANGGSLGTGFLSRIGFVVWYAVPVACVGFGDPAAGAVIFGLYGATRGFAVWLWFLALNVVPGLTQPALAERLFDWNAGARRLSAGMLVVLGALATVVVGL